MGSGAIRTDSAIRFAGGVWNKKSVGRTPMEKVAITLLRHPTSAGDVAFPSAPSPVRLTRGIDMQHDFSDLLPIGPFCVGIEQAQISDGVAFVVSG